MRIVLCTPYADADILVNRIKESFHENQVSVDECYDIYALCRMPRLSCYDAVFVAFDGIKGLSAVSEIREENPDIQIVWMCDDRQFCITGYDLGVSSFILKSCTDEEIREALEEVKFRNNMNAVADRV